MLSQAKLIETLESNAKNADSPLERRLADFTVWYFKNLQRIPEHNLQARVTFQEDALWILIEMIAMMKERMDKLATGRAVPLILPSGMAFGKPFPNYGQ